MSFVDKVVEKNREEETINCIIYCQNYLINEFLINFVRCKQWITRVQSVRDVPWKKLSNGSYKVCQLHFEDWCFMNEDKKRLVWDAVPTKCNKGFPTNLTSIRSPLTIRSSLPPPKRRKLGRMKGFSSN